MAPVAIPVLAVRPPFFPIPVGRSSGRHFLNAVARGCLLPETDSVEVLVVTSAVTPVWSDDFSGHSLAEVMTMEAENRAWHRTLRLQVTALVDSRLAKQMSQQEYSIRRVSALADASECKRRGRILVHEIRSRGEGIRDGHFAGARQDSNLG
jgi:hypothetical protein